MPFILCWYLRTALVMFVLALLVGVIQNLGEMPPSFAASLTTVYFHTKRIEGLIIMTVTMTGRRKSPLEIDVTESHMCSLDVRLQILGKVPFFAGLSQDDLEQINRMFREHGFALNEIIYFAGDPAKHLLVVADGRVKLMRHSLSGKEVLLDLLTPLLRLLQKAGLVDIRSIV
jgi:hypothetical protein